MDVTGLTFQEAVAARPGRRITPAQYREALNTGGSDVGLRADVAPVVKRLREGDLVKFLQRLDDGLESETVIVPMYRGPETSYSLCLSSQVGCAMGCTFCETAQLGLLRSLTPAEIVGQALAARRVFGVVPRKIVFMGMGEPLDNFEAVVQAVRVLSDPCGLTMSRRRITISTVGRVAGIRRLAGLGWTTLQLAVSLNAPNDEIRGQIMPINRADDMASLRRTLDEYPRRPNTYFMIEYVLIPGVNDAADHARQVAAYLRGLPCCVNVIPYNPRIGSPWPAPDETVVTGFIDALRAAGQFCKRRATKGRTQMAACGQLGNRELVPLRTRRGAASL